VVDLLHQGRKNGQLAQPICSEIDLNSCSQERIVMGDKGSKDKGKKEQQKKAKLTPKEKRKAKLSKKTSGGD